MMRNKVMIVEKRFCKVYSLQMERKATDSRSLTDLDSPGTNRAVSLQKEKNESTFTSHGQVDRSIEPGTRCSVSQLFSWPPFLLSLFSFFQRMFKWMHLGIISVVSQS